jgi:hypothetical protein
MNLKGKKALTHLLETPYQLEPPMNRLKRSEAQEVNSPKTKKSTFYDLTTGKILKEVPTVGMKYLTQIFDAMLKGYFLAQWKVAQILILKAGNPPTPRTNILLAHKPPTHYVQSL